MRNRVLTTLLLLPLLPSTVLTQERLSSASNVRLRTGPTTDSAVVTTVPLGTELHETGRSEDGAWARVAGGDGFEGWILASLTTPVPEGERARIIDKIIRDRLAREGDGFQSHVELLDFVERSMSADWPPEFQARLALYRLQALRSTLPTIPFYRRRWSESMRSWVSARSDEIRYNEPGGSWMVRRDVILEEHTRHKGSATADEIAWLMVVNGVPGECEGSLLCLLRLTDVLEGEYLRREPSGAHVDEALDQITARAEYFRDSTNERIFFDPGRECADLLEVLSSLRSAVAGSSGRNKDRVVQVLNELRSTCPA